MGPPDIERGRTLEKKYGQNLHQNHPTIDVWDEDTGSVTSIKSVNLEAPSHQAKARYVNTLYAKLSRYLNELAEYKGSHYAGDYVPGGQIASRTLAVIVPSKRTVAQQRVLRQIVEVGKQRGLIVRIKVHR
jgi:hypothetical protein